MAAEYNEVRDGAGALAERLEGTVPLLLDGATGTELERRGIPCELPLWSARALMDAPEDLFEIHRAYVEAGADALTANSFRTQQRTLSRAGAGEDAAALTQRAVALARRAADAAHGRRVFVLGSAATLEDCFRPDRVPEEPALSREHAEHARLLVAAGVDAILVETMNTAREAVAALRAARDHGAAAVVSFVCADGPRLLSGELLADALAGVAPLRPLAVGVNCLPPSAVPPCLPVLRAAGGPFAVYANLGAPLASGGRSEALGPAAFADQAHAWWRAGARAVGGCCGTTPAHIAALRRRLDAER